jgi:hypothetical protein
MSLVEFPQCGVRVRARAARGRLASRLPFHPKWHRRSALPNLDRRADVNSRHLPKVPALPAYVRLDPLDAMAE